MFAFSCSPIDSGICRNIGGPQQQYLFLNDHARYIAPLFLFIDLLKVPEWSMFLKPNSHEGQKSYETYAPQMAP